MEIQLRFNFTCKVMVLLIDHPQQQTNRQHKIKMFDAYQVWDNVIAYIASGISALGVWSLIIAILRSPKVRTNTFNLYIVFVFVPDGVYFSLMLVIYIIQSVGEIQFITSDIGDEFFYSPLFQIISESMRLEQWLDYFWLSASLWMSRSWPFSFSNVGISQINNSVPS